MFRIVPEKINFNFIKKQVPFAGLSIVVVSLSLICLAILGLKFGTDFTGGTELHIKVDQKVTIEELREALLKDKGQGLGSAEVQSFGSAENGKHDFLVKVEQTTLLTQADSDGIKKALKEK